MRRYVYGLLTVIFFLSLNSVKLFAIKTEKLTPRYKKSAISNRNLISTANYDFDQERKLSKVVTSSPDTIKILAIRVEFKEDTDRNTTGNGKFDLSNTSELKINPPPHDRVYFENQLLALADYFKNASQGKLILIGEVYPKEINEAYQLSNQMSYYNPNTTDDELDHRLAELFRDSFMAADATGDIDFSSYNCFIIFHPGVGSEYTFDLDSTPNDLPSVFLNFQDLKKTIGKDIADFDGIKVTNSIIRDGTILPETESQMGFDIGLLGTAALMFGHQIGLPNLYDTDTGHPGIGVFGLMDQGSSNFSGLLPAQPCAWSKVFLGWEQPVVVTAGTWQVAAALAEGENKIYKVPINSSEYFLIENRQRHVLTDRNTTVGYDVNGVRIEFKADGSFDPPAGQKTIGVIVTVDEYDFGLPGSGILIWHIDENVIEAKYHENRVNTDMDHRGVDLEEADGAQDIGHFFNFFGITGYESGTEWDLWFADNEAHQAANDPENTLNQTAQKPKPVAFTPNSIPNTNSYSMANSHIFITNFSKSNPSMEFTISIETYQANFPQATGAKFGANAVLIGNIDDEPSNEIIAISLDGKIFAWHADGEKVIQNSDSLASVNLLGDTMKVSLALFAVLNDSILHTPALADLNEDSDLELIVGTRSGFVYALNGSDADGNGRADLLFIFDCQQEITTSPLIDNKQKRIIVGNHDGEIIAIDKNGILAWQQNITSSPVTGLALDPNSNLIVTTKSGDISMIDQSGKIKWQYTSNIENLNYPALGDLTADGAFEIMASNDQGSLIGLDSFGNLLPGFPVVNNKRYFSNPTLADLDRNGSLEIILAGEGEIFAYNHNGTLADNFPIMINREMSGHAYPDPIIADLENDGDAEIIVSAGNQIFAFHHTGEKVTGFPLSVGGEIRSTPFLSDLDNDSKTNLSVISEDGFVYTWNLGVEYNDGNIFWGNYLHDIQHTNSSTQKIVAPPVPEQLMPEPSVYNWPNPTEGNYTTIRYWLNSTADVTIRIYDMAGELVKELIGTGFANTANEIQLSLDGIQSGVYLTRVEAKNSTQKNVSFFKMAVVK